MEFFTLGVYHSTESRFLDKLKKNGIDAFCDIRQRRGVRGPLYPFANAARLEGLLAESGIRYRHVLGLAPTEKIKAVQLKADAGEKISIRDRTRLDPAFAQAYTRQVLDKFDVDAFLKELKASGARKVVLFCVEEHAEACHRSLVAGRLHDQYHYKVTNL